MIKFIVRMMMSIVKSTTMMDSTVVGTMNFHEGALELFINKTVAVLLPE